MLADLDLAEMKAYTRGDRIGVGVDRCWVSSFFGGSCVCDFGGVEMLVCVCYSFHFEVVSFYFANRFDSFVDCVAHADT